MNGEVLGPSHGYPVRLVVPGWYGMASVKWLAKIQVIDHDFEGFHQNDYYVYVAEGGADQAMGGRVMATRVKSLISWPSRGDLVGTGSHIVRGVAWSGEGSVTRVEVSADDDRTWHEASVQDAQSPYAWHNWEYIWEATYPGYYLIRARATDSQGNVQPLYAPWNFRGYAVNSVHGCSSYSPGLELTAAQAFQPSTLVPFPDDYDALLRTPHSNSPPSQGGENQSLPPYEGGRLGWG